MLKETSKEKRLVRHSSFLSLYDHFLSEWREYYSSSDSEAVSKKFSEFSNRIENGIINNDSIIGENLAYISHASHSETTMQEYNLRLAFTYAVAARRAHDRAEVIASFSLLSEARYYLGIISGVESGVGLTDNQKKKSEKNSRNAGVPYERLRYKIIGLLEREYSRPGWTSIDSALDVIQTHLIDYIDENELEIEFSEVGERIVEWCTTHSAFRAELSSYFVEGVIER